ncbi:MAG: YbjN domain-containing protein [Oscillospiraceae bacterium]|nr:YbjN domain-containing protein [Oscillospiraceae bacterium]
MAENTIELIAEAFDRHEIKYKIIENEKLSFIDAGFNIQGGPTVRFHFFAQGENGHDVQIRISGLMNRVSGEKRAAVLEACNRINSEMRFVKFYLDKEGTLFGQADLPTSTGEDCVGEGCFELFLRCMQILDQKYHYFPEAYYSSPGSDKNEKLLNTLNALKDLSENPLTIRIDDEES